MTLRERIVDILRHRLVREIHDGHFRAVDDFLTELSQTEQVRLERCLITVGMTGELRQDRIDSIVNLVERLSAFGAAMYELTVRSLKLERGELSNVVASAALGSKPLRTQYVREGDAVILILCIELAFVGFGLSLLVDP